MKTWITLLAAFIAGCFASVSFGQSKTYEPQTVSRSICRISFEGYTSSENASTSSAGSCTVIEPSLVLTAAHVVCQSEATVDCAGEKIKGKVIALNLYRDWALVRLERPIQVKPRSIRKDQCKEGEVVFSIGYGGQGYGYTRGRFVGGIFRGRAVSGDSGGPICDVAGKLVGVVTGYASDGELLHVGKGLLEWVEANKDNDPMELGGK
jgi:S1-C subfamily serine protease